MMKQPTIFGAELKALVTHHDERGYFREIIRSTDPFFEAGFGQWSLSLMHTGVAKAWHVHQIQWDWWYVAQGALKVALHDLRVSSPTYGETNTFFLGDDYEAGVLAIPPGVAHGCRALQGPAKLMYITSQVYNPADEGRVPHDDPAIGFDWTALPPIQ